MLERLHRRMRTPLIARATKCISISAPTLFKTGVDMPVRMVDQQGIFGHNELVQVAVVAEGMEVLR